jgi:hypothetical protein
MVDGGSRKVHLYGIIRIEEPVPATAQYWTNHIAGIKAYDSLEDAEAEAARLQSIARGGSKYFVVILRKRVPG